MGDVKAEPRPDVPAWQQGPSKAEHATEIGNEPPAESKAESQAGAGTHPDESQTTTLENARKFLQDPEVQKEPTERKIEFLRSKGISPSDVEELAKDSSLLPQTEPPVVGQERETSKLEQGLKTPDAQTADKKGDRPPIITYPEFLTKPARPPPLMTANGFFNMLYAFGGIATVLYGTSKYVLEPMVHSLTEARVSLHESAKEDVTKLVAKLETMVSEIPPAAKTAAHTEEVYRDDDEKSSYEDPTELFHRDIGVQTSLPSSPIIPSFAQQTTAEPASQRQARQLAELVASVKSVTEGIEENTESFGDIKAVINVLNEDLDRLTQQPAGPEMPLFARSREPVDPDDQVKHVKDSIRRMKGVLLTSRNFPASTR